MYGLMSAVHIGPWLRLMLTRRGKSRSEDTRTVAG